MTSLTKTQCPHCQTSFDVLQTQLNKANATLTCEHCQQSFFVNQHLVVTPDTSHASHAQSNRANASTSSQSVKLANPQHKNQSKLNDSKLSSHKKQVKTPSSSPLIHDDLIYDDMDIDEPVDNILEYDSLDSMDAWLGQVSQSSEAVNESPTSTSKALNKNSRSSAKHSSVVPPVLSSVAANNIHVSVNQTADNSWLEELLKEQNQREDKPRDDTDLSQLLLNMGVPIKDENKTTEDPIKKSQAQTRFAPALERQESQSVASLLWTLGCLVLALLLFAQYVIFNLENLVKNPAYAQRLQAICSVAACSLPSADLTAFTITSANHRPSQIVEGGSFSDVSATLNNQSAKGQLYPHLKVSVYGTDKTIGEFIAAPEDYLLSKQNQLAAGNGRQLLLTIPVANAQIREITISPLY